MEGGGQILARLSGQVIKVTGMIWCHLCFKQAQPKMCHSSKVDDGVDKFFKTSCTPIFGPFFVDELQTDLILKPFELFN